MAALRFASYNTVKVVITSVLCRSRLRTAPGTLMRKVSLAALLAIFPLVFFTSALSDSTVVEDIVARVNNAIITQSEFERSRDDLKQELQERDPATVDKEFAEEQKNVLRRLIDQQLLLQKGSDLGITAETETIKRLDEMRKQMHLDSMEAMEKAAESQGVSFEDFKQKIKNQIVTQQVIGREVGSKLTVTKEEEQKYYDEHKSEMDLPEQIRLSELLIAVDANADEQQLAAAKAKADDILAQIRKGANFEDLAKKDSNGPSAAQGGDLGYFKRGALAKQLEEVTFQLKAGGITDVIRTKQGFVILKVTEHDAGGIPAFKDIEPRVQDAVYMDKMKPALDAYLMKLREDAYIDIKQGYVDTGASPNETKPVETNTKQANAKQLKKKKKLGIL